MSNAFTTSDLTAIHQQVLALMNQATPDHLERVFFRCLDDEDIALAYLVANVLDLRVGPVSQVYFDMLDSYIEATTPEPFVCPGCPGGWCEGCIPDHSVVRPLN